MRYYLWLGSAAAVAVFMVVYTYFVYDKGRAVERARIAAQVEEYRENQRLLIEKLEKANAQERIIYRTKIKTIRAATDDTGCADSRINPDILNQLR